MAAGPRLSVVMPVFNNGAHLDAAVQSILAQEFGDFEFIILDDGSSDDSVVRLRQWAKADPRIRLFEGSHNRGLVGSANFVVEQASAPLIARMDADDIAHPARLSQQTGVFKADPRIVLVGTLSTTIDGQGGQLRQPDFGRLFRPSPYAPFCHSSIMFRRDAFERIGGYRAEAEKWEDVDLFLRFATVGRVMVIARPLMQYRNWGGGSRAVHGQVRLENAMGRMHRHLARDGSASRLDLASEQTGKERILPEVFVTCGSGEVWQGRRPKLIGRFWRRAQLSFDIASASALIWVAWADLSPRSLRAFLSARLAVRNLVARRRLGPRTTVEWQPSRAARRKSSRTPVA